MHSILPLFTWMVLVSSVLEFAAIQTCQKEVVKAACISPVIAVEPRTVRFEWAEIGPSRASYILKHGCDSSFMLTLEQMQIDGTVHLVPQVTASRASAHGDSTVPHLLQFQMRDDESSEVLVPASCLPARLYGSCKRDAGTALVLLAPFAHPAAPQSAL